MVATFRRPGVYLEETLLAGPNEFGSSSSVALFVGAASRGPVEEPVRINSWNDYVALFGDFSPAPGAQTTYLPYAVYSFFHNGGRVCFVQRSTSSVTGAQASYTVVGKDESDDDANAFTVLSRSTGVWADSLHIGLDVQQTSGTPESTVYTLSVFRRDSVGNLALLETFRDLSVLGDVPGTKRVDVNINDSVYGSKYVYIDDLNPTVRPETVAVNTAPLSGGTDGGLPSTGELASTAISAATTLEFPLLVNIAPHRLTSGEYVLSSVSPTSFPERNNVFVVNDAAPPRPSGQAGNDYADSLNGQPLYTTGTGDSYMASYTPWVIIQNPAVPSGTITVPPGGSVVGIYARNDAQRGVFSTPAGINAQVRNAVDVDARFTTEKQGDLNSRHLNVIRPTSNGICIMGGRTRKQFGADKYVSARRTLLYIQESLKNATQFAVFENNSELLWNRLISVADNIVRPVWQQGGLRGSAPDEAYYIVCDSSINTPAVIQSGEVRMNVGVALEYPAEFITIRVSQFDGGGSTIEIEGLTI